METKYKGLTTKEAAKRLNRDGYNELPSDKKQNVFITFLNVIKEPMLLMLLGSGALYLMLGETKDALMLLTFVVVVVGITFYQERKTERALDALKNLASPKALVVRDGIELIVQSRELVKGDVVILKEGDRVPADAVVLSARNLLVDESLLTGESLPVRKVIWDGKMTQPDHPGGEDLPFIYSGAMVVQGRAIAEVTSTGVKTEIGKIGKSLREIEEEDTLLKKETGRIVKNFSIIGLVLCLIIIAAYIVIKGGLIKGLLAGITLGMAMLPEEFPVVLLIFLTLGAWRMSKRKVLTRKTAAIETLGAATVLCTDKTGTLTHNQMRLDGLMVHGTYLDLPGQIGELPEDYHALCEYSYLASQKNPFDPIEKGIKQKIEKYLSNTEHIHPDWKLVQEYPLSKELLALSHVWQSPNKKDYVIAAKGAPEAVADLCHLNKENLKEVEKGIKTMSEKGLRVLGVARAIFTKADLPKNQHDYDFEFVGLIGFTDPIRSTVVESLKECYSAGVRVIMITGDYYGTAQYIARQIGLKNPDRYISGSELSMMDHQTLRERIKDISVFARVVPEQKLMIVNALKANGEIVAMTGDGINDAPALKAAHIGIAMGERGTDVAREAADLVLLNDDFSSIVSAIRLGRRIFDNLKKTIGFILSVHIPIAGMSLLPVLFNMPIVLMPAHIAFLELIIDPACSVVFEAEKEEHDVMNRPPRSLKQPLIDSETTVLSVLQGLSILATVFIVFLISLHYGLTSNEARTLSFVTIVFGNLLLIVTNLSRTEHFFLILGNKNKSLYALLVASVGFLFLILNAPFLRNVFYFSPIDGKQLIMAFSIAIVSLVWFEGYKIMRSR